MTKVLSTIFVRNLSLYPEEIIEYFREEKTSEKF